MSFVALGDSMNIMVMPPDSGNVLAIESPAREINGLSSSRKFTRPRTAGMTRKRQQPIQNILAEPMHVLPKRRIDRVANGRESMARGDALERVEICNRADDVYVRELRLAHQKLR
jgi:hypothetical protein